MEEQNTLEDNNRVYRSLRKKTWIHEDTGQLKADAYVRRRGADDDGLSVNVVGLISLAGAIHVLNKCHGVFSLGVSDIRSLGLNVIPDRLPHALIVGIPFEDDNPLEAERLAGQLAKQSCLEWHPGMQVPSE